MRKTILTSIAFLVGSAGWAMAEVAGGDGAPPPPPPAGSTAAYVMIGIVLLGTIITLAAIRSALANSTWSMADALSENTPVSLLDASGAPVLDATTQKPITYERLTASSSRMIALVGTIGIFFLFIGFGSIALYEYAVTGKAPAGTTEIVTFLASGLTLFAPYVFNKVAGALSPAPVIK